MRLLQRSTDVVFPLDGGVAPASTADDQADAQRQQDELDWAFEDPELTLQLQAVKRGRGVILTMLLGSITGVGLAILLVL